MEKYNILKDCLVCLFVVFQLRRKILRHGRSMMDHVCAEGSLPAIENNPPSHAFCRHVDFLIEHLILLSWQFTTSNVILVFFVKVF